MSRCGSCWSFSSTAALESAYYIGTGTSATTNPIHLSEQHLVSCVNRASTGRNYISQGCDGGNADDVFDYVMRDNQTTAAKW